MKRMLIVYVLLSFFVILISYNSLHAEEDILGWGKAKWGMTHLEWPWTPLYGQPELRVKL
jgi:hypothetical protein